MTWHAVDAVDEAVEATRRFLFPFSPIRWAKIALLVVLMGGGVSTNVSVPPIPNAETTFLEGAPEALAGAEAWLVVTVVVAGALLTVLLSVVSLSLRLVFYDALRTNRVRLWKPFRDRLRQALGLFGFSLAVGVVLGGPFAIAAVASERSLVRFEALPTAGIVGLALAAALLVVTVLLVLRLTYEFVVPVMVVRDEGVLAGWRRFWPTLRGSWVGFVVYLVVHFFLALGVSIAETVVFLVVGGTVLILAALALLVVGGVLGGLAALTGTTAGIVALVLVTIVALATLFVLLLPVRLVTRTYLIAYEVSTLGGIDRDLALLAPAIDPAATASTEGETGLGKGDEARGVRDEGWREEDEDRAERAEANGETDDKGRVERDNGRHGETDDEGRKQGKNGDDTEDGDSTEPTR